jgi:hypothetical protein
MFARVDEKMHDLMRSTSLLVFTLTLLFAGCGGKPPHEHYEKSGGFSYDPPKGWEIVQFPGLKYRVSHGPSENQFAPNINVVDERFAGTLPEYVDLNVENMKKMFTDYTLLKREDFQTGDGQSAIRLIIEDKQQGRALRQTFCFFGNSTRKYVVTCTALAEHGDSLDGVFAESMKTFRLH